MIPAIPAEWDGFAMEKTFRGKKLHIIVDNAAHRQSGISKLIIDGSEVEGELMTAEMLKDGSNITVIM